MIDQPERVPAVRTVQRRPLAVLACAIALSSACAGGAASTPAPQHAPPAASAPAAPFAPRAAGAVSRALATGAPFIELIRVARALAQRGDTHASADCVMGDTSHGYRLEAELMLALDVLPDPPADLDALLQNEHGPLAVVSGWGVLGAADASLVLTSFTATPPQRLRGAPSALLLTDQGAYLRSGARPAASDIAPAARGGASADADGPLPPEAALQRLQADPQLADGPLFVSAEASVPLSAIAAVLQALPPARAVAFAVVLPSGTRLPAVNVPAEQLACPNGLPDIDEGRMEGAIDARALTEALRALQPETERCLSNATGAGRAGGTFTLALRIAASGSAEDACIVDGDVRDPSLISCVLQLVRAARFPRPSPPGFVDVHVPLRLQPTPWPEVQPWCGAKPATATSASP